MMDNDIEKTRFCENGQLPLFPVKPLEVCNSIGLNWLAAEKLYEDSLLSFNPSEVERLDYAQESELVFLGRLVVAGCDKVMLERLLKSLKKPYQYKSDEVYYDWSLQKWRRMPHLQKNIREKIAEEWLEGLDKGQFLYDWINEIEPKDVFKNWIDDLLNEGDMEQLVEIEKACTWAISRLQEE